MHLPPFLARAALGLMFCATAAAVSASAPPAVSLREGPVPEGPAQVELRQNAAGFWRFYVNGAEFPVFGAGGAEVPGLLEHLKAAGGNCVRTWGLETLEKPMADGERFIDRAWRLGLMVVPGIWIDHERHGFDYSDPAFIARQRAKVLAAVQKYKNHPAVLAWGLGNEMEGPLDSAGSIPVFQELEELCKIIKQEDPGHPVMSVIAILTPEKIRRIEANYPSLDILGINTYGGAAGVGAALQAFGWKKPFTVAEFGVNGFWEVPKTAWGASIEPATQEKARSYYAAHRMVFEINDGKESCLGTFAFLWGWKQEYTPTWFGMFLPTLEKLPQVDAMTKAWTGKWPANRCPRLDGLACAAAGQVVKPDQIVTATARVGDPEGDPLDYEWVLASESTDLRIGGESETAGATHPERVQDPQAPECVFTTPAQAGNYRLYLTVRDGQGNAATANFPFRVEP